MAHKHILELLTEGQYATVAVYFETESQEGVPKKPVSQPRKFSGPWDQDPDQQFPFLAHQLPARTYTYKVSHEMAKELKTGDFVVVPGFRLEDTYRVAKVWQVHATAKIDFEAEYAYKWIVQKLDTREYEAHLAREVQFAEMLREVEKAKQREAIRATLMNSVQPGTEAYAIFQGAVQLIGGNVAPAPAPVPQATFVPQQTPVQTPPSSGLPSWAPPTTPPAANPVKGLGQFAPPTFGN